jgi:outer membrane protein assembly factor BamB
MRRALGIGSILALLGLGAVAAVLLLDRAADDEPVAAPPAPSTTTTSAPAPTTTVVPPFDGWVDPASAGRAWPGAPGIRTFRGNATRTYYGQGPVPTDPEVLWSFPEGGMCSLSVEGIDDEPKQWCGSGWTGQPAVFPRERRPWVVFGGYDRAVHWLDGVNGERLRQDFVTGDLIKGSVTVDPDGFPLVYVGSRDDKLRVIAFDRDPAEELWSLDADDVSPTIWNNDWDGSPLVLDDHLFEGGENSQIHVAKLNRGHDDQGRVTVAPELVWNAPGWDDQLLADIGDSQVSIENSVAVHGNTLYFANSGGLVQGWDISGLGLGFTPERTFRFWTGDDTDASVVVDEEGMLYVGSEFERFNARSTEVGQIMKLDPADPDDPLVWSLPVQDARPGGVWATPALHGDMVYVATDGGELLGITRDTGEIRWSKQLPGPVWQSPVVVDDVLIQGDCAGALHAYDVADPTIDPPELWQVELGGCIESTPAVWGGRIYVGTRAGQFHAIGDRPAGTVDSP